MTEPRPLSDAELITWGVILERRRQQAAGGITLLLQPYPPCPTCGKIVTDAATVEDFGQGQLTVKPCGHDHNFNVGDVYRLSDHIAEMVDLLEQASRRPAGEGGWTTADIVRAAAARTTPDNPAASSDTADNPLQQRIAEAVAPILDVYPEHNRIDEHVVSEITAAVLAVVQPELDALDALRAVARGYCPACGRGDAAPTVQDWEQQRQRAERAEAERDHLAAAANPADVAVRAVQLMQEAGRERDAFSTGLREARTTNQRLNRRTQELESELAAYRRAVAEWQINEQNAYIPLRTIAAIAKAAGLDIPTDRFEMHYQRLERAEAALARLRALAERWRYTGDRKDTALPELLAALDQLAPTAAPQSSGWTPPPPGDRREQLPDSILAAIDVPPYTSTACHAADQCSAAIPERLEVADELGQWADRLHARCRINNKFTGQLCACGCHQAQPAPAAASAATLDDILLDRCPHCPERVTRSRLDEHVTTAHADLPPCSATFDTGLDLVLCAFRVGHRDGEYGDWHATARDEMGRTVWNDGAHGATPHRTEEQR